MPQLLPEGHRLQGIVYKHMLVMCTGGCIAVNLAARRRCKLILCMSVITWMSIAGMGLTGKPCCDAS